MHHLLIGLDCLYYVSVLNLAGIGSNWITDMGWIIDLSLSTTTNVPFPAAPSSPRVGPFVDRVEHRVTPEMRAADPRKGKQGQSCAECRRFGLLLILLDKGLIPPRSKLKCDRSVLSLFSFSSHPPKEYFLVSHASEGVVPLYVQMVRLCLSGRYSSLSPHAGTLAATRGNK